MATQPENPRTRRAVLAAALGAGAAAVAATVAQPAPVAATNGGNLLLGTLPTPPLDGTGANEASTTTGIHTTIGTGLKAESSAVSQAGLEGRSSAISGAGIGVFGTSDAPNGYGVFGFAPAATGAPRGVYGQAIGPTGIGVHGQSLGGASAIGVLGTGAGVGVRADSDSGLALEVVGKAKFSRSGRASIAANAKYVDVTVPGGLTARSLAHATIQTYRAGVAILAARPNWPTAGKIRIYLTKVASTTASTPVAWLITEF